MPTNQKTLIGAVVGWIPSIPLNTTTTLSLNAANTWLAFGFRLADTKILNKVKVRVSSVSGTLTSLSADIYSSTAAGSPNASIESSTTVTGGMPTGASWIEFTGFTTSCDGGTQYWIVLKNLTGTPASNFPAFIYGGGSSLSASPPMSARGTQGWGKQHTTDGSTWVTFLQLAAFMRLEFSDGSFAGIPIQNIATNAVQMVYSSREYGVQFTSPAATLKVRGIAMHNNSSVGSPTQNPYFKLYTGGGPPGVLLASTQDVPKELYGTSSWYYAYFTSTQTIPPSVVCTVTMAENTQTDTSANAFRFIEYTVEDNADSKALLPLGGLQRVYYDGSSWTLTDTAFASFALLLDTDAEISFTPSPNVFLRTLKAR